MTIQYSIDKARAFNKILPFESFKIPMTFFNMIIDQFNTLSNYQ